MGFCACLHPGAYWLAQAQAKPMSDAEFQALDSTFRLIHQPQVTVLKADIKKMKRRLLLEALRVPERTVVLAEMDALTKQQQKLEEMFGLLRAHCWIQEQK